VRPEQPSASVTAGDRVSRGARSFSGTAGCCQAINSGGLGAAPPSPHIPGSADRTEALHFHPDLVPQVRSLRLVVVTLAQRSSLTDRNWYARCDGLADRYQPAETQKFRTGPTSPKEWYRQGPLLTHCPNVPTPRAGDDGPKGQTCNGLPCEASLAAERIHPDLAVGAVAPSYRDTSPPHEDGTKVAKMAGSPRVQSLLPSCHLRVNLVVGFADSESQAPPASPAKLEEEHEDRL
jgi:hypothetical protein